MKQQNNMQRIRQHVLDAGNILPTVCVITGVYLLSVQTPFVGRLCAAQSTAASTMYCAGIMGYEQAAPRTVRLFTTASRRDCERSGRSR